MADFRGISEGISRGFQRGVETGGRLSPLGNAIKDIADHLRSQREAGAEMGRTMNILGTEGLIKGTIEPAQQGEQGAFDIGTGSYKSKPLLVYRTDASSQLFPVGEMERGAKILPAGMNIGLKESQQQDKLEQNAIARLSSIRGDISMARIETQRDASIQAYNIIEGIKAENRLPSQIEYYDILGQMWKARTGSSPTDQALRDLDAKTFKGNFAKAVQYFTGKPAGITTEAILNNVQDFAKKSGQQADKLHEGYMKTHLIKPEGLDEDRWNNIKDVGRGLSFEEAIKSQQPVSSTQTNNQTDIVNVRDPLGRIIQISRQEAISMGAKE